MDTVKFSIKNYWNWRSNSFGHDSDKSAAIADRWESIIKELASQAPGLRALDIGTGTGQLAVYLACSGFNVTGIDLADKMISSAKKYAESQMLDIDFHMGDAEELKFEDNSFDIVVSRNLLWTLPHPDKALKEWRRVLKPDGKLIVCDGFWLNTTWKRIHHLAYKILKGIFKNRNLVSLRFFLSYAGAQRSLPLYEGISFEKISSLLNAACFRQIQSYDTCCLDFYPYGKIRCDGNEPSFFIAHAKK